MAKFHRSSRPLQGGFSYTEVLLSMVLMVVLLVPALQALNTGIMGGSNNLAARQLALRSKMEEVLSKPFAALYAQTYLALGNTSTSVSASFSDAAGAAERRVVVFYRFDAGTNALSSNDTGLLYLSAYFETEGNTGALRTLLGRWW